MQKKLIITLTIILWSLYAISNAFSVTLNFPDLKLQSLQDKFSPVHFMTPGNDFGGSIFRLASKSVTGETIKFIGQPESKICTKLVRGIYFNSQRGKRLRPLDKYTLELLKQENPSYNDLQIEGGLYTSCDNGYSVFGYIKYIRWGISSYIVAGTKLDYQNNRIIPEFSESLQYFDNKVPIGYIYDSNGGIGYIWGELSGQETLIDFLNDSWSINDGFTYSWDTIISDNPGRETTIGTWNAATETMRNLIIQGSVGLSKSINEQDRISLLGNLQNKTVIYNGSDINSSTLINFAKQKSQELCKGKTFNPDMQTTNETILCYENTTLTIDLSQTATYENKTIIVKSGNVVLQGGMQQKSPSLDLFIDRWLIYLPNTFTSQTFNDEWFPDTTIMMTSWLYLKGNFIINGLIVWGTARAETGFNHKLHLQGKITTLNTPFEPNPGRIGQIETIFGNSYDNLINLQNVFVRECGLQGTGSDGTQCNTWSIISATPLVILNENYPSNILQ